MSVSCCDSDMGGGARLHCSEINDSPSSSGKERDANFSLSLPFPYHLLLSIVLSHSSSLEPSSLHPFLLCQNLQRWPGLALTDEGVLWERLSGGIVFHWWGESIMPHGEENTGAFLLAGASADQTQNTLFPVFRQLTLYRASLAQARRPSDCTSVLLKQPRAQCNM